MACNLLKDTRQGYGLGSKEDELASLGEQCNAMLFSPNALKVSACQSEVTPCRTA